MLHEQNEARARLRSRRAVPNSIVMRLQISARAKMLNATIHLQSPRIEALHARSTTQNSPPIKNRVEHLQSRKIKTPTSFERLYRCLTQEQLHICCSHRYLWKTADMSAITKPKRTSWYSWTSKNLTYDKFRV